MRQRGKHLVVYRRLTGKKPEGSVEDVQVGDVVSYQRRHRLSGRAAVGHIQRVGVRIREPAFLPRQLQLAVGLPFLNNGKQLSKYPDCLANGRAPRKLRPPRDH